MKIKLSIVGYLGLTMLFTLVVVVTAKEVSQEPITFGRTSSTSTFSTSWVQVNADGFGIEDNYTISSLTSINNYLYAGTGNNSVGGAQLWRSSTGTNWTVVSNDGLGDTDNGIISDSIEFKGMLYVGVANETDGGKIYRSSIGPYGHKSHYQDSIPQT